MDPALESAFARQELIRPSPREPDLVHLVRAIAHRTGITCFEALPPTQKLTDLIGPSDHVVFALLDGLGMHLVRRMPPESFLVQHRVMQIRATFPSTTACALTSVATGHWPAQHGISGWFTYLPELGITITLLPFTERYSQQSLTYRGLTAQAVLPIPGFYSKIPRRCLTLLPSPIVNTSYANWSRDYTPGAGYQSIAHAVDQIIAHVNASPQPSYAHLYAPEIDSLCHRRGVEHPDVLGLVMKMDHEMRRLAEALRGKARIVICADHGLIDIAHGDHMPLFDGDPLLAMLQAPPSGDARLPIFHVRPGRQEDFVNMFNDRFSQRMTLMPTEEAQDLELFGPKPMSDVSRQRFGHFVGIAHRPATLLYHPPQPPTTATREPYLAQHAGLSSNEMLVPLIIA